MYGIVGGDWEKFEGIREGSDVAGDGDLAAALPLSLHDGRRYLHWRQHTEQEVEPVRNRSREVQT